MSSVDFTAFRFITNAACLLFVDSIRGLVKFSPITVWQFLQYNTTFTHNPFLSVIEALTYFLERALRIVYFKKVQKKLVWTRMNSSLSLTSTGPRQGNEIKNVIPYFERRFVGLVCRPLRASIRKENENTIYL